MLTSINLQIGSKTPASTDVSNWPVGLLTKFVRVAESHGKEVTIWFDSNAAKHENSEVCLCPQCEQ